MRTKEPIPRVIGASDIVYIGKTSRTIRERYITHSGLLSKSKANKLKYEYILDKYGPIRITYAHYKPYGIDLGAAEDQILWWYFQNHCEFPPVNYTIPKIKSDSPIEYIPGSSQ